jgi:cytoskeletal protein CcmA (bactofilin family)
LSEMEKGNKQDGDEHLDEMSCLLYAEGQLDRARALEVSSHALECARCRTLLKSLESESRLLARAMHEEDEPLPSRLAAFEERTRRSMQWVWGLVMGLAATGIYAFYTGYVEPWQQRFEQAGFGGSNLLGLLIFQGAFWKGWGSVITFLEILAALSLGALALALFRRRLKRVSATALMVGMIGSVMALPPAASATEFRKGESVEVKAGETIHGDVNLSGEHVRIDGTIDGDVYVFGQHLDVKGHVTGDVLTFSEISQIDGQVDGNIRAFTKSLTITGTVGKNVTSFCERVDVEPEGKIGGSASLFAKALSMEGTLGRDLMVFGERLSISGKIAGNVQAEGGKLEIGSEAEIGGTTHFKGPKPPEVAAGAKLASPLRYEEEEHRSHFFGGAGLLWRLLWFTAMALFGAVLILIMPKLSREAVSSAQEYGISLGLGALVLFAVPIVAIMVCFTVIGLFVGVSALFLWGAALFYANVIVGAVIGQRIMGSTSEPWPLIGRMLVGVVIVYLCSAIPHMGWLVEFGVILWGMGAISLAIYRRFYPKTSASAPLSPGMPPVPPSTTIGNPQPA